MKQDRGNLSGSYSCNLLFDLIHSEDAELISKDRSDFYKGMPVLTANTFGKGKAWYVSSSADGEFLTDFLSTVCDDAGVHEKDN
ncbi:beta-galactosidase trimerization domain-containing protein [Aquibacillus sediminis]|uniref:beta-galactosidase trimerization domain-containing protein n=1 Tax=Aquibacillus sediminis TaxID=2574734 RepID=UPI001FE70054|nr:beta-galactosidase trimerization domain-containing protein [Aquibacillus sediminis]